MAKVCDAVEHAHRKLVIHRDLKPGNILVTADGQPKVLDFGIAKLLDPDVQVSTIGTRPEEIVGTLPYMSPEQALGDPAAVDVRSDVYSLGAVLYELLAGRPPLELRSGSLLDAVRIVREDDPPRLTSINRGVPRALDCVVAKALAKSPEKRYTSAGELAADLRRHLAGEPVLAAPRRPWDGVRAYSRRHKAVVASAGAAALALSVGLGLATWQAIEARQAARVAEQRFEDVRALANTMIFDLHDAVAPLPGSTPARRLIVDTGLEYLDALAASGAATPELRRELAEGYLRIGEVLGDHRVRNLGDLEGAEAAHQRAVEELEALLHEIPADPMLRRMLAQACIGLTFSNGAVGGDDDQYFDRAVGILEQLLREQPEDAAAVAEMAMARRAFSLNLIHAGELERGLAELDVAIAELERWPGLEASFEARRALADLKFWPGYHRWERDRSGVGEMREALTIQESLVAERPGDPLLLGFLASIHSTLGRAAGAAGAREEAIRSTAEAISITAHLYERDADDQRSHRQLSISLSFAGETYESLAEHAADAETARADLRQALEHYLRYRDMVAERVARGWLHPWESHYPAEADEFVARVEVKLAELEQAIADREAP